MEFLVIVMQESKSSPMANSGEVEFRSQLDGEMN